MPQCLKKYLVPLLSRDRFGKFVSVGVIGAVFDTCVLVFFVEIIGLIEEGAVLINIESAVLLMFVLNDRWTYAAAGDTSSRSVFRRLLKSHLVRSGGVVTQFIIFVIVYRVLYVSIEFSGIEIWLLVAKAAGIAIGMVVNYTFESLFTWSIDKPASR